MSSLAATQADGMYIPPDYLESGAYKKKSINQYVNSKGHNQYEQRSVVRFELPFDGFCTGCGGHVGKGTRFNARKDHVDDYFTTKIYEFTTKCRSCADVTFKIRTDPKNRTFDYVEGIRKKIEEFDTVDAGTVGVVDTDAGSGIVHHRHHRTDGDVTAALASASTASSSKHDPLSKLERSAAGERRALTERDRLTALLRRNDACTADDDMSNSRLRATFRVERQSKKRRRADAINAGLGKGIELAESTTEDGMEARMAFGNGAVRDVKARRMEKDAFRNARAGSIFASASSSSSALKRGSRRRGRGDGSSFSGGRRSSKSGGQHRRSQRQREEDTERQGPSMGPTTGGVSSAASGTKAKPKKRVVTLGVSSGVPGVRLQQRSTKNGGKTGTLMTDAVGSDSVEAGGGMAQPSAKRDEGQSSLAAAAVAAPAALSSTLSTLAQYGSDSDSD